MTRRVGVGFDWQGNLDREGACERARAAENACVDSVWVAEAWGRDAFSLLTQLAERTSRLQLGTSIVHKTAKLAEGWLPVMIPIDQLGVEIARVHDWIRAAALQHRATLLEDDPREAGKILAKPVG